MYCRKFDINFILFFKVTYVVHVPHTQHTTLYYPPHDVARQIAARALANKAPTAPICFQSARIPSNSIGYSKSVLLTRWHAQWMLSALLAFVVQLSINLSLL